MIVDVTEVSQEVLAANDAARVRILLPVASSRSVFLGLDSPAVPENQLRIDYDRPWRESSPSSEDQLMFRGQMTAVHNYQPGEIVSMLVLEGEEVVP